jgi:phosphopantothenoylcysteine decarboxylase/phosphopantothenate--cysteine ligase
MTKNPDIIAGVDGEQIVKIGFAAETQSLLENASGKLTAKGLDMIVANDAVATIGSERVRATLLFADGRESRNLDNMSKEAFARELVGEIVRLCEGRAA